METRLLRLMTSRLILKIQDKGIELFRKILKEEGDKSLKITVLRDGEARDIDIKPDYSAEKIRMR